MTDKLAAHLDQPSAPHKPTAVKGATRDHADVP